MIDKELTKKEFPITKEYVYLEAARISAPSKSVNDSLKQYYDNLLMKGEDREKYDKVADSVRQKYSQLIHAKKSEIAIIKNTTEGINIAASGLDVREGENVVTADLEHRNNAYPWLYLSTKGAEVRVVNNKNFRIPTSEIISKIDSKTRAVGISHVQFLNGFLSDLNSIADACNSVGALLVVDGIQSVGKIPIDVKKIGIDVLSSGGHKGLLAGRGIGLLYCDEKVVEKLKIQFVGPDLKYRHDTQSTENLQIAPGAKRFEAGSLNYAGVHALESGLDIVNKFGIEKIHEHNTVLVEKLYSGVQELGADIITSSKKEEQGGIVTFALPDVDPSDYEEHMRKEKILINVRNGYIRISPHFYNTLEDIETFLEVSRSYLK